MTKLNPNPAFTLISHTRHGDKVMTVSEKKICYGLMAGVMLVAMFNFAPDFVARWEKRENVEAIRPAMQRLANKGKPEAKLWIALHSPQINRQQVASLAAAGLPEAMFVHGWLIRQDDKRGSDEWIARAAAAGWVPALEYQARIREGV